MNKPEKIKVLLIKDGDESIDIIVEDGGYAYCWKDGEGFIIEYYQGRIDSITSIYAPFEDVCLNNSYNNYRRTYRKGTKFDTVLKNALNWLIMGSYPSQFEITTIAPTEERYDIVNKFLNLTVYDKVCFHESLL
jgi:hypothetical protein